jgi:type IX secretion system PorP/SprF family membrane protein
MNKLPAYLFRLAVGAGCTLLAHLAWGQQKPHYTQYILNQYVLNPALSGIENYLDVKLSHRHQWSGIADHPVTTYLTVHGPIGKKDYRTTATSFAMPGENPRGESYWEQYTAAEPHHGVGLQVVSDQTGPLSNFAAYATYAYHLGLSPRTSLSAGFGVGVTKLSLNAAKLSFANPVDPAVANSSIINRVRPDVTAGVYLYSADFFVGLSAQQVVPQNIDFSGGTVKKTDGRAIPHLFATAGFRTLLSDDLNLTPSVLIKYITPVKPQVDLNCKLQYRDLMWAGVSYRTEDAVAAMVGLSVSNTFNVGYSYDYTTSGLSPYSRGTHEILVGFLIGNRYGDTCPRNVW